jgi:hypothetical protein
MKESVDTVFTNESVQASLAGRVSQYIEELPSSIERVSLRTVLLSYSNVLGIVEIEVESDHVKLDDVLMYEKVLGTCEIDDESSSDTLDQLVDANILEAPSLSVLESS